MFSIRVLIAAMMLVQIAYGLDTFLPTSMPTGTPTTPSSAFVSSWAPTFLPTSMPTGTPTTPSSAFVSSWAPSSFPTPALNTPMIVFGTNLNLVGVSADTMTNDLDAQSSAVHATAKSMGNGVTSNMLSFVSATDTSSTRRLRDGRKLPTTSCDVNILANIPVQAVDGGNDANVAYDTLVASLSASVSSGTFTQNLQDAAAADGASDVLSAATVASVTEEAFVEYASTATPTHAPTYSPSDDDDITYAPNYSPSDDDDVMDAGTIAGIVIGAVVGFGLICGVIYYFMNSEDDAIYKSEGALPPFRKPRSNPDSNLL